MSKDRNAIVPFVQKGIEIAGAAAGPLLSTLIGDPTGAATAQLGVVVTKQLADYVGRSLSDREVARSAAAVIYAVNEVERRMDMGEEIRDDDFFRIRTGAIPDAQILLDGVLIKAKAQYEERKIALMGKLFASITFDKSISGDDASWLLSQIDNLTYRHLLILAAFYKTPEGTWDDGNIFEVTERNPVVAIQIRELRNLSLLNPPHSFSVPIAITPTGKLLVESSGLIEELHSCGEDIKLVLAQPATPCLAD